MPDWDYHPKGGYRNATDEADWDLRQRAQYAKTDGADEILRRAAYITEVRAAEKRSQAAKLRKQRFKKWIFNPLTLAGVFAGLMMWWGFENLQEARHHTGTGYITYERGTERVSESEYRRHYIAAGIMLPAIGIFVWLVFAKVQRDKSRKKETQERLERFLDEEQRKLS